MRLWLAVACVVALLSAAGLTAAPTPAAGLTAAPTPAAGLTAAPTPAAGLTAAPTPAAGLTAAPTPAADGDGGCAALLVQVPPAAGTGGCAAGAAAATTAVPLCADVPAAGLRCPRWAATYDFPGGHGTTGIDMPFDVVVSLDGSVAFVTGQSWADDKNAYDVVTIAYDVASGEQRWLTRHRGSPDGHDIPQALALSPDGEDLFVAGWAGMSPVGEGADYLTLALDATTGEVAWEATYDGSGGADEAAYGVSVSPDGSTVIVTGKSGLQHGGNEYATVAYDAATGAERWAARFSATPGAGENVAISSVISGDTVVVTGAASVTISTLAYDLATGEERWRHTHPGGYGYWTALSPDGATAYVAGSKHHVSGGLNPDWDFAAIALDVATGEQLWMTVHGGPGLDVPYGIALDPSGDRVYLAGVGRGAAGSLDSDMLVMALDAADGDVAWTRQLATPGHTAEGAGGLVVAGGGDTVVAAGWSSAQGRGDAWTVALDAADGAVAWTSRYHTGASPQESDLLSAVAATPDGASVVATGRASYSIDPGDPANLQPGRNGADFLTLAFDL